MKAVTFHAKTGAKTSGKINNNDPVTAYKTALQYVNKREAFDNMCFTLFGLFVLETDIRYQSQHSEQDARHSNPAREDAAKKNDLSQQRENDFKGLG